MGERQLLSAAELDALGRLRLRLRRRVATGNEGAHRARGQGSSLDFDDHRPYQPGDDPRRVDRHAYRRLGRLLVTVHEAEDDTGLQVVLDASTSMAFGVKPSAACRLAAALAVVAAHGGDRTRLVTADAAGVRVGPWRRGRAAVAAVLAELGDRRDALVAEHDRLHRGGTPTGAEATSDLGASLHRAVGQAVRQGRRGPVVLVSDLLLPGFPAVLGTLAAAPSGAACVQVLDAVDLDPDLTDDPRLVDSEGGPVVVGAATPAARRRFAATRDAWLEAITTQARQGGVAHHRHTGPLPTDALVQAVLATGVVG